MFSNTSSPSKLSVSAAMDPSSKRHSILIGFVFLGMLMLIPATWAWSMRQDTVLVYFLGSGIANAILYYCSCIGLFYFIVMFSFFARSRPEMQTDGSLLVIAGLFMMILGLASVLAAMPLTREVKIASNALYSACGPGYQRHSTYQDEKLTVLATTSQKLQALRSDPNCSSKMSVEECNGFEATAASNLLKEMEYSLGCSGFCFKPNAMDKAQQEHVVAVTKAAAANVSLTQAHVARLHQRGNVNDDLSLGFAIAVDGNLLASADELAQSPETAAPARLSSTDAPAPTRLVTTKLTRLHGRSIPREEATDSTAMLQVASQQKLIVKRTAKKAGAIGFGDNVRIYPPTLFSQANSQASCDGMAARFVGSTEMTSSGMLYSGVFLLSAGTLANAVKLIWMS